MRFRLLRIPEVLLFGFTLALRLFVVWRLHTSPYGAPETGDMKFYSDWGLRIAQGQLFEPHAFYGEPLYAYLLGGIFAAIGFHPALIGVVQSLLDALTAVLIFRLALLVFTRTPARAPIIGLAAALGWAFFVPASAYCGLMISVPWIVAGWWFCIWWLLQRSENARSLEWLLISILVGLMAMMSAIVLFLIPLFLVQAFVRRSPVVAVAIMAGVIAGAGPCWAHNFVVARDPVFLSAHGGINLWIGNNPEANGYPKVPHGLPSEQAHLLDESIAQAEAAAGHPLPRSAVSAFWSAKAHQYVGTHFWSWLGLLGVKAKNFWNNFEYDDLSSITALRDAGIVPPGLHYGLLAVFGLPGCLLALRVPRARWIIAAVVLQMIALLPVFVNERYRLIAAPGLLLLASYFVTEFWDAIVSQHWLRMTMELVLVGSAASFVTLPPPERALWSLNDYKTARRQIVAGDYSRAEYRLHRAFEGVLSPAQMAPAIANTFAESARERLEAGDHATALRAVEEALHVLPNDENLRALREQIARNR